MATYPPPTYTEYLPIFNPIYWEQTDTQNITIDYLNAHYLKYPVAQGAETLNIIDNLGTLNNTGVAEFQSNIVMSGTPAVNYIEFPDGTKQYSAPTTSNLLTTNNTWTGTNAFNNASPPTSTSTQPASTDSSTIIPTTAWVQSAISASTSVVSITAYSQGYNSAGNYTYYYFSGLPTWSAYTWNFHTPATSKTAVVKSNLGSTPPLNVGTITANSSFVFMRGIGISQPYTATSSTMITYCAGFQQQYTISASATASILTIMSCIGATPLTPFFQSNQLGENNATCPPTATSLSGYVVIQLTGDYTGLGVPTLVLTKSVN